MSDEAKKLLDQILEAMFFAELCPPHEKAAREQERDALLARASDMSGRSAGVIKEALLKARYPQYRSERLKAELASVPPKLRRQ